MTQLTRSILVAVLLLAAPAPATLCGDQRCGDCNGDGLVAINELVTAVTNALQGDGCGEGCFESGACPETCVEFPSAVFDERVITCATSICADSQQDVMRCVALIAERTPSRCSEEEP